RAPERAADRPSGRHRPPRVPPRRAVRERLDAGHGLPARRVRRCLPRDRRLGRAAHGAELVPSAALQARRQGAHGQGREPALDRRDRRLGRLPRGRGAARDGRRPVAGSRDRGGGRAVRGRRVALVRAAALGGAQRSIRSMTTSSRGRSAAPVSTCEIASTTSIPPVTWPKTVCFPSSHGHASAVTMKNWLPFVFGPAFAIASAPRATGWALNSSSNVYPGPPVPVPVGSPP